MFFFLDTKKKICDGTILCPKGPTNLLKQFIGFEVDNELKQQEGLIHENIIIIILRNGDKSRYLSQHSHCRRLDDRDWGLDATMSAGEFGNR